MRIITSVLLGLALVLLTASPALAQGADVEGVWTFNGGQVAVKAASDGTHTGTVIRETTLANCAHAPGEVMWVGMTPQPDGQWFGGHQWFQNADCSAIAQRGKTAYRVLMTPDGARFLRVCFAAPDRQDLQPTIAPDGTSANTTTSCDDSEFVAPLSNKTPSISQIATLPKQGKKRCLSKRRFRIRLKEPAGDALDTAIVTLNGKRIKTLTRERITAPVNLVGLPKGRYRVKITATTVLGRTISGTRKYRTCVPKKRSGRKIKV